MIRHKRTIEQKFKAIVAMIVAMGLVSGFTLQDGTISDAWSIPMPDGSPTTAHTQHDCNGESGIYFDGWKLDSETGKHYEICSNCSETTKDDESEVHIPVYSDGDGSYYCHDAGENKDYPICKACGYVDKSGAGIVCDFDTYGYDDTYHWKTCKNCGEITTPEIHASYTPYPISLSNQHNNICVCGRSYHSACTMVYKYLGDGNHKVTCDGCHRDETIACSNVDSDGFCLDCEKKGIAAKTKVNSILDQAKTKGWNDSYRVAGSPTEEGEAWAEGLSNADFNALYDAFDDFLNGEYENASNDEGLHINDYMITSGSAALMSALRGRPTVFADPEIAIKLYEIGSTTPVTGGAVTITQGGQTVDYNDGDTVEVSAATTGNITKSGTTITLVSGMEVTVKPKTAPNSHNNLVDSTYTFTPVNTSGSASIAPGEVKDGVFEVTGTNVNIYYDNYPTFSVKLFKDTTPLAAGSIKFDKTQTVVFNVGDEVRIGAPPDGASNVQKVGKVIYVKPATAIDIKKDATPAGCEALDDTGLSFTVGADGIVTDTAPLQSTVLKKAADSKGIEVYFKSETAKKIDIKFFDEADTAAATPLSPAVITLTGASGTVDFAAGDTINISASATAISKTGTVITLVDSEEITISSKVPPMGYKGFTATNYKFTPDYATHAIAISGGDAHYKLDTTNNKQIDIFYEPGTAITLTASGTGKPDSVTFVVKNNDTGASIKDSTGTVKLGEGTYTLSATAAKAGYKVPSGTFKVKADGNLDTTVSGDVSVDTGTTVTLKYSDDKDINDVDFVKYPKKEKKDEPDTDKDKLTGWAYKLERYTGSKSDPTDDDDNWTDVATVKPSSTTGTKYTLDGEKIYTNTVYRLKETTAPSGYEKDSKYVYIKFDENGDPSLVSGKAAVDDNEVQLYDVPEDEDSDDVIAIHKVNNTGTNLSGAHLQIYLYSDSNTLVYGSSTSSTSSSTSNTSSSTNSSTNSSASSSSTNSSTNRSTSSSTTKAKTTPAKPSVATNDVKFDWTTTDKAKVIDIGDLEKGKNYTLREVSAPSGYETPAYDFVFKYGTDGKLTIVRNYNGLLSVTGNKLVLKNLTPTEAAATRPKTGDHSKLALWLDICIVMLGGLYLSGYSIFESFTEKKKVKVVAKKKSHNRRKR